MSQRLWRIIVSVSQTRTDLTDSVPGEEEEHPLSVYSWLKIVALAEDEREAVTKAKAYLGQFSSLVLEGGTTLAEWPNNPAKVQVEPVEGDVQGFFYSELDWSRREGWEEHLLRVGRVLEAVVKETGKEGGG